MKYEKTKKTRAAFMATARRLNGKRVVVSWLPISIKPFKAGPLIWGTLEINESGRVLLKSEKGNTYLLCFWEIEFIKEDKRP